MRNYTVSFDIQANTRDEAWDKLWAMVEEGVTAFDVVEVFVEGASKAQEDYEALLDAIAAGDRGTVDRILGKERPER